MRFDLTDVQAAWESRARTLARALARDASAGDAIMGAARAGLLDPAADLLSVAVSAQALAAGSPAAAVAYAMHVAAAHALRDDTRVADSLWRGDTIGALALSADDVPTDADGRVNGQVSWVAPLTSNGVAIIGARAGDELAAFAISLQDPGATVTPVRAAGLRGLACAHLMLNGVQARRVGPTAPVMARARVLMAAVGLGIGACALQEALTTARAAHGADAGEQTVQGLLADTATELEAARLLTWTAAAEDAEITLGKASVAKLAATDAAQRAVRHATQVVGAATFARDHTIERLAQDVRALELFAGRTEALRGAVAEETLTRETR